MNKQSRLKTPSSATRDTAGEAFPTLHSEYGTVANYYVHALYEVAGMQGLNADQLLRNAGIHSRVLTEPRSRLPSELLAKYQRIIWVKLGDEAMGLYTVRFPIGTYYMMGQLTVQQQTLREAISLGARFYNLMAQRRFIDWQETDRQLKLTFHLQQPPLDHKHLFAEICLLSWHRYVSWLITDRLPLTEIHFPYEPPPQVGEYNALFPGIHKFNSDSLSVVFPSHYLQKKVQQSAASLKTFMYRCPLELFRQYKADYSLCSEVKRRINKSISGGNYTIEAAAKELHTTTRTLMRKLKNEGTSFQQLKDRVRRDRAIALMADDDLTIRDVAEHIGYSDPAVFSRAFRAWTGSTPLVFRRKLVGTG